MILKGANNWNEGLMGACQGGHSELVELMISNGANNYDVCMYVAHDNIRYSGPFREIGRLLITPKPEYFGTLVFLNILDHLNIY